MTSATIGHRIREARTYRNMSQSDLAKSLDKSRQYMHSIESGKHEPSAGFVALVAQTLCVNGNYLLGLSEDMTLGARRPRRHVLSL